MKVLIPMAGAGSRFTSAGYSDHKPVIPVSSRRDLEIMPMVIAAVADLPVDIDAPGTELMFIVRDFHVTDGVTRLLSARFPNCQFTVLDALTEGQASTCLAARSFIQGQEPLLIAACDNGMEMSRSDFEAKAKSADALVLTFRGNEAVLANPKAYGWLRTEGDAVLAVSIKQPISDRPMDDHAVVGTFWFRHGDDFLRYADTMIAANDRINNEFYVDQIFKYLVADGRSVRVAEISRYICWGTPQEYENYESTLRYWQDFVTREPWAQ